MAETLCGTWRVENSENFDEFLKEAGVPFLMRGMATQVKPDQVIEYDGDEFTITIKAPMKTHVIKFKLGESFEFEAPFGGKMKATATLDGDVLTMKEHNFDTEKDSEIIRQVKDGFLIQNMNIGDVKCIRTYKKVE